MAEISTTLTRRRPMSVNLNKNTIALQVSHRPMRLVCSNARPPVKTSASRQNWNATVFLIVVIERTRRTAVSRFKCTGILFFMNSDLCLMVVSFSELMILGTHPPKRHGCLLHSGLSGFHVRERILRRILGSLRRPPELFRQFWRNKLHQGWL